MKGAQIFASYTKQPIPEYAGNPLIEALPPILTDTEAAELISNFPQPVDPEELTLDGAIRIHCIDRLRTVVQPFLLHLDLESMFSLLIRRGTWVVIPRHLIPLGICIPCRELSVTMTLSSRPLRPSVWWG